MSWYDRNKLCQSISKHPDLLNDELNIIFVLSSIFVDKMIPFGVFLFYHIHVHISLYEHYNLIS
jgi:hypothetical protein